MQDGAAPPNANANAEEASLEMLGRFVANTHRLNSTIDRLNNNVLVLRDKMTAMEHNLVRNDGTQDGSILCMLAPPAILPALMRARPPEQQQMACYMPFKSSLYEFNSLAEKVGRRFALLLSHDLMGPCACAGKQRQKLCGQHKCAWILSQLA